MMRESKRYHELGSSPIAMLLLSTMFLSVAVVKAFTPAQLNNNGVNSFQQKYNNKIRTTTTTTTTIPSSSVSSSTRLSMIVPLDSIHDIVSQHHHTIATTASNIVETTSTPSSTTTIETLLSTMFSPSITMDVPQKSLDIIKHIQETDPSYLHQQAQGHTDPMFGSPDPFLHTTKSLSPLPGHLNKPSTTLKGEDIIRSFDAMPGFKKTGTLLPQYDANWYKALRYAETVRYTDQGHYPMTSQDVDAMTPDFNKISRVVWTAFIYTAIDFLAIRPMSEVYSDDIDDMTNEERSRFINKTISVNAVRAAIIAAVGCICWNLP